MVYFSIILYSQPFNAYVKYNFEKCKPDFHKWNPDRVKKVTPDSASQIQVAVNSEGKTNEATKNLKVPLRQGQVEPTDKQKEEQAQKSKGIRR